MEFSVKSEGENPPGEGKKSGSMSSAPIDRSCEEYVMSKSDEIFIKQEPEMSENSEADLDESRSALKTPERQCQVAMINDELFIKLEPEMPENENCDSTPQPHSVHCVKSFCHNKSDAPSHEANTKSSVNPFFQSSTNPVNSNGSCMRKGVKHKEKLSEKSGTADSCAYPTSMYLNCHTSHPENNENMSDVATAKRHLQKKTFTQKSSGERLKFKCSLCKAAFSNTKKLRVHIKRHRKGKSYQCLECSKSFTYRQSLRTHNRIHTGDKPYLCPHCPAAFGYSRSLQVHVRTHTGDRPFVCSACSASFTNATNLRVHRRIHTGEKPYLCSVCSKSFAQNSALKRHMKTHTGDRPFHCSHCPATFPESGSLKVHIMIHTGEKPHKCCECDAAFITAVKLRKHMRSHTGVRPYSCSKCSATYRDTSGLYRHTKKIHTDDQSQNLAAYTGTSSLPS